MVCPDRTAEMIEILFGGEDRMKSLAVTPLF